MNEPKHTPGPWEWASDWNNLTVESDGRAQHKCMDLRLLGQHTQEVIPLCVDHYELGLDFDPAKPIITPADRALIAAAPELLEMLQEAVSVINGLADQQAMDDPFYVPTLEAAKALISKAKGEARWPTVTNT